MTTIDWNAAGGLPPELESERQRLMREQRIADAMMGQRGYQPPAGAAYSPFGGLADMVNAYSARKRREGVDKGFADLGNKYQTGLADAVSRYTKAKAGTPESTETIVDEQAAGGEGATAQITAPAVKGDPRKAIIEAMTSPYAPVQRVAQMDLTQLNRQEDRADTQAFQSEQARLQREQRAADLQARLADQRISAEERAALQRELAQMQIRGREEMVRLAASLRPAPQPQQQPQPRIIQTAQGPMQIGADNRAVPIIGPDNQPIKAPPKGSQPLSATAQKELFEADDVANSSQNAITILKSIITPDPKTGKSQNDVAYEGGTANVRRIGMSFVPIESQGENATVDLQNKVTGQALEQLKAVFGGMPTEGERKVLMELQGSVNQKASQRKEIFERAIKLAERRLALSQEKAKKLREGTYFGAGVATNQDGNQTPAEWAIVR